MWKKIREKWKSWRRWKKILIVAISLIILRMLLFESFSMRGHMENYANSEKYQKYILFKIDYSVYNFALFQPNWKKYQYNFLFQWDYYILIHQIKKDVRLELETLLADNDMITNYEMNEKTMVVDIYYNDNISRDEYDNYSVRKVISLCSLWHRIIYGEAPENHRAEVTLWNAAGYPIS